MQRFAFFRAINPCSENSGIVYCLAGNLPFQDKEMKDITVFQNIYNAFNEDLRGCEGIDRTFDILVGNHYDLFCQGYGTKGVLDYLIFPLIARKLIADTYLPERRDSSFTNALALIIAVPLEVLRFVSGAALTISLIPIVILVDCCRVIGNIICSSMPAVSNPKCSI